MRHVIDKRQRPLGMQFLKQNLATAPPVGFQKCPYSEDGNAIAKALVDNSGSIPATSVGNGATSKPSLCAAHGCMPMQSFYLVRSF